MTGTVPANPTNLGEYDVAVIGGGVIGAIVARELSKMEGRFALLEKESFPGLGISKAGLSQIHLPDFCPPGSLKGRLCKDAPERFKALSKELDTEYREKDELWLALNPSQMENLKAARSRGEANGATGYEIIGPERLRELEPHATPEAVAALYAKGVGVIYTPEWTFALFENAVLNGVRAHMETTVTGIKKRDDGSFLIITSKGALSANHIINAAGLYADEIAGMVGDRDIRLALRKGTMLIFDKSASHLVRNMLFGTFSEKQSQDIAPTSHGNLILGVHYVPPAHKKDTSVPPEGVRETLKIGRQLVPALSERDIITSFTGILATPAMTQNGDFYIAPSESASGMIHVMVGAPGLSAAPGIADLVIKMLQEAGLDLPENRNFQKKRVGWDKFEGATPTEKTEMIAENSKYGHILCRCEHVTEAEIVAAINKGANTLDAVKHLTRAGMGRCQGGFCGIPILKHISEQMGIPPTEVTKKGEGSEQITGLTRAVDSVPGSRLS